MTASAGAERAIAPPFRLSPARTRRDFEAAANLFKAYAASLPVDLGYQDFGSELAELPGKYSPPDGELLIAWDALERPVGCVGLRPLASRIRSEMKRLYVVPGARSFGLGKILARAIVSAAQDRGYVELVLDTLPTMATAAGLYQRMGFKPIDAYYDPTPEGTIFMRLELPVPVRTKSE